MAFHYVLCYVLEGEVFRERKSMTSRENGKTTEHSWAMMCGGELIWWIYTSNYCRSLRIFDLRPKINAEGGLSKFQPRDHSGVMLIEKRGQVPRDH